MKFHIDKEHMFPDQKDGKTAEGKTEIEARTGVKGQVSFGFQVLVVKNPIQDRNRIHFPE